MTPQEDSLYVSCSVALCPKPHTPKGIDILVEKNMPMFEATPYGQSHQASELSAFMKEKIPLSHSVLSKLGCLKKEFLESLC